MDVTRKISRGRRPGSRAVGTDTVPQTITVIPTDGVPVDLTLPLTARVHHDKFVLLSFLAAVCFFGVIELGLLAIGELEDLPRFAMGFPLFAIAVWHHIRDSRDPRCSITLYKDCLWDSRISNSPIPWSSFSRADIVRNSQGIAKVNLVLRCPVPQLRLGWFRSLFGPPSKISSDMEGMTISADVLANAIACMVVRHGGTARGTGKYVPGRWDAWDPAPNPDDR